MCQTCPDRESYRSSLWFNHIWFLRQLQEGGYPFAADDLELTEWMALAEMKAAVETPPELPKTRNR